MAFINEDELQILAYWINERDKIRRLREDNHPWPWTDDNLLREYRWCNVRRMDDLVSRQLMTKWYNVELSHNRIDLAAAILGRLINWPDALLDMTHGHHFGLPHMKTARLRLTARVARGEKTFTGAYIVPGVPGRAKVDSVLDLVEHVIPRTNTIMRSTQEATWANLIKLPGLGSFLAGQIVADLAHLPAGYGWPDKMMWAPVGPGSARGLNRLFYRPKDKPVSQEQFNHALMPVARRLKPFIHDVWADRKLCAMDIQNCLCEFDKYRRLTLGEGTVRARYKQPSMKEQS